jgi:hypothetical protein
MDDHKTQIYCLTQRSQIVCETQYLLCITRETAVATIIIIIIIIIIIRDNERGTCMLIDVAISGDRNVIKKKPRRF